jgi:hypothetical protein
MMYMSSGRSSAFVLKPAQPPPTPRLDVDVPVFVPLVVGFPLWELVPVVTKDPDDPPP